MPKDKTKLSHVADSYLAETIYQPGDMTTVYLKYDKESSEVKTESSLTTNNNETMFIPLSSQSGYIQKNILKLPSNTEPYSSQEELFDSVRQFIHDYVDLSEEYEVVCTYYVLMTWLYDRFDNLPYLRVRGNPGCGKSRFLEVMSALTYKSTFFRADPTEAIIFRSLDTTQGTLLMDEADFRFSGKTSGLTKILNNGFQKGSAVARNVATKSDDYQQEFFHVFGPKIIANRSIFQDDALESRCLTFYMGQRKIRDEVKRGLGVEFESRAIKLRNQLLQFRFNNYFVLNPIDSKDVPFDVSARSQQICAPLVTLMTPEHYTHLEQVIGGTEQIVSEMRSTAWEVEVLEALVHSINIEEKKIALKEIAEHLNVQRSSYEEIKSNQVGNVLTNLNITRKRSGSGGQYCVDLVEHKDLILRQARFYDVSPNHRYDTIDFDSDGSVDSAWTEPTEHTEVSDIIPDKDNPFVSDSEIKGW